MAAERQDRVQERIPALRAVRAASAQKSLLCRSSSGENRHRR